MNHCLSFLPSTQVPKTRRSSIAWHENSKCGEAQLSDALILEIFQYFDKRELGVLAQVSKRWRRVAYDKSFWHALDLTAFSQNINEETMLMLIQTRLASTLHSLNLGSVKLTAKLAKDLSRKCTKLKRVVFKSVSISGDPAFSGESKQFPASLELMDLRHCEGDFQFMKRLPRHFTGMKFIGLGAHSSVSLVPTVFSKMHNLRVLDCYDCSVINDQALEKISRSCRLLESICLNECKNFEGKSLGVVFTYCLSLSTLLMRFTKLSDDAIVRVKWENTVLRELDITGCYHVTTTGLTTLLSNLPHLTYFKMNQCGFRHILNLLVYQEIRPKISFTMLETLDLRWNFLLSADCMESILRLTPKLRYLGVSHSPRICPSTMARMLPHVSKLKILEYGPLKKEVLADTDFVAAIVRHCKDIEAVSFINFIVSAEEDRELLSHLQLNCRKLQDIKLCDPKVENVEVGTGGEMLTVERLLIKMESLLPSPKHTLNVITETLC